MITLTFKVLNYKKPLYLFKLLEPYFISSENSDAMITRSDCVFKIPFITKKCYDYSFCIASMNAWNKLPISVRKINNINTFKSVIKKILLDKFLNS